MVIDLGTGTQTCRWGIWSTGLIAGKFASDLDGVAGAVRHSVLSRKHDTAEAFAEKHGISHAFDDVAAFLADERLDAVYIASPHIAHCAQALAAINAGKAVLIEKPIAMSTTEARFICEAAKAAGVLAMEALWSRFLPAVQRAKAMLDSGALGAPVRLEASLHFHRPYDPTHRLFDPKLGGGVLHDLGVYPISLARYLAGPLQFKSGQWTKAPSGVDKSAQVEMTAGETEIAISVGFEDDKSREGENSFVVICENGTLRIDRHFVRAESLTLWDRSLRHVPKYDGFAESVGKHLAFDGRKTERFSRDTIGLNFQAAAFQAALAQGQTSHAVMPVSQSVDVLEIIEKVLAQEPV